MAKSTSGSLSKAHLQIPSPRGIRASACYLEGVGHIQSIAVRVHFDFRPLVFPHKVNDQLAPAKALFIEDVEKISHHATCLSSHPDQAEVQLLSTWVY